MKQVSSVLDRCTEKARRTIFFARYEAGEFGSPTIESEHLLLGLLRENKALTKQVLRSRALAESVRKQINEHTVMREKIPTSVDLPLSAESKRALAYAVEEAGGPDCKYIGAEHLLLGLLRVGKCFAAQILRARGVKLKEVRAELASEPPPSGIKRLTARILASAGLKSKEI